MGWRGLFEGWHLVVLILLIVIVFGWKRLPDAARSLGRSMRIFKSEVDEMRHDPKPSAASQDTVNGETVSRPEQSPAGEPAAGDGQPTPGATPAGPGNAQGSASETRLT